MKHFLSRIGGNPDIVLDLLGALAISGFFIAGIWIAYGLGVPTGGDELIQRVR